MIFLLDENFPKRAIFPLLRPHDRL